MLKLHSVKKMSVRLESGEIMYYLPLPDLPYAKLRSDFLVAAHLAPLDQLDLKHAGSVMIKCHHPEDGLLAASYVYKKHEAVADVSGGITTWEEPFEEYPMDWDDEDEEDEQEEYTAESVIIRDNRIVSLPVISASEFMAAFAGPPPFFRGFGAVNTLMEKEVTSKEPYWLRGNYPLVIESPYGQLPMGTEPFVHFEQQNRFLIYICPQRISSFHPFGELGQFEKSVLFEINMEVCTLEKPSVKYYERILSEMAKSRGYRISKAVNTTQLIKDLMEYRGNHFRSSADIETLVNKAINKKRGDTKTLTNSDFTPLFVAREMHKNHQLRHGKQSAVSELEQLIGLEEVKRQLLRIVKRMKFDHMRKANGYSVTDTHMALVFMGNPGTAKTTVARIFGKMLVEEGILANNVFREVSRKDMIGKYLGWTAPQIEQLFMECKGGTIFLDEAYSLMNDNMMDEYAAEALAEMIRQMENNPDTLVIFAGYPDKMSKFLQNANPGLRSRLTHIIEFKDYSAQELWDIFLYFVNKEEYLLECPQSAWAAVQKFLDKVNTLPAENLGNGRLMRRLFKAAVSYMAERDDHDLRTIKTGDIEKAAEEIWKAEIVVNGGKHEMTKIGFC